MDAEQEELEGIPAVGDVVLDKYRVDRVLGVGGMGCVVAAQHLTLDQPVAIKFLLSKAAKNPKNLARFEREAQAAAKIKSDHVAKVSDIGRLDDGSPYMVMEYLDGCDLADRLEQGRLPVGEAVAYLLQACEALAEAHQAGIVHRDLKPANLFLARMADGTSRVKVLDFGISKFTTGGGQDLTRTSALMGSPLYMSPEQMMSAKSADHRTDIWALGCILFELLSGQPPFLGETLPEICSKILAAPPTPLEPIAPHVPAELRAVIDRCLTKEPEQRYANLGELAIALAPFAGPGAQQSLRRISAVLGLAIPAAPTAVGHQAPPQAPGPAYQPPPVGAQTSSPQVVIHPATTGGGYATTPGAPGAYPQPTTGDGATSYPQPTTGDGATSYPQPITGDGATSYPQPTTGDGSAPLTMNMPQPPAGAASTAAPVAQTMNDEGRKSRGPIVGLAVAALLTVGAAGLWFGTQGADDAAADAAAIPIEAPESDEPTVVEADPTPNPEPSPEALASATAEAEASASAEEPPDPVKAAPVRTDPKKTGTVDVKPRKPRLPPRLRPKHQTKPGDDSFNTY